MWPEVGFTMEGTGPQWEESLWKPELQAVTLSRATEVGPGAGTKGTLPVTPSKGF